MENDEKIKELLTRGVEDVFVRQSLSDKLQSGKKLRVKLGFDPTGSKIHIGRAIILRKLKADQVTHSYINTIILGWVINPTLKGIIK